MDVLAQKLSQLLAELAEGEASGFQCRKLYGTEAGKQP
jgi:hypothetical protein